MQVIPAVDILDGSAVRLMKGDYARVREYGDDPVGIAEQFVDDGASLVHVVDLDAARGRSGAAAMIASLGRSGVAFQLGGGIRNARMAREAITLGARRVVIGSVLLGELSAASEIVDEVGADAVVAAIDVRDGRALGSGWTDGGIALTDALARVAGLEIQRALVTGIETDGTMDGPAVELFAEIREKLPGLRIIASGGVGSLEDVRFLSTSGIGVEAVIIGRAFYENRFTVPEAIKAAHHP